MRRSLTGHQLSDQCLDACKFKLEAVLERLTAGHLHDGFKGVARVTESSACASNIEFALKRNLAANRSDWSGFLTRQVLDALERIDNGRYGLCLLCGQPISARRLAALPWVTFCIPCQERKAKTA
jgi:RNA polymerase-binding transcription factor DksA